MAVPEITDQITGFIYEHPQHDVYLADVLTDFTQPGGEHEGGWPEPHLYCLQLNLRASPEIDTAELVYTFARQIPLGDVEYQDSTLTPADLRGKAIRIRITATDAGTSDIVWFGVITTVTTAGVGVGEYRVVASGPLLMATYQTIRHAISIDANGDRIQTDIGRSFNLDDRDVFGPVGNRAASKVPGDDYYVFAFEDRGRSKWDAQTAVEYLLAEHGPRDDSGFPMPPWVLHPDVAIEKQLSWYEIQQQTDGQTLKDLLDSLIPRKRGLSYYAAYDPATQRVVVKVFTFVATPLQVGESDTGEPLYLPANQSQLQIDPTVSVWVDSDMTVTESNEAEYDEVVAYGERKTTTLTFQIGRELEKTLVPDWSEADETAYKAAASTTDTAANAQFRVDDKYGHVYSRFKLDNEWNGDQNSAYSDWRANPYLDADGNPVFAYKSVVADDVEGGFADVPIGYPIRNKGVRFLSRLPLKERIDYSGDKIAAGGLTNFKVQIEAAIAAGENISENLPPLFFWSQGIGRTIMLDMLTTGTGEDKRQFSCDCSLVDHEPAFQIRVTNRCQTLLAKGVFDSPAPSGTYDEKWDPVAKNGVDYRQCWATVCVEFEQRLTVEKSITSVVLGRPRRRLEITVDNARMDWVMPRAVVAIENAAAVYSDTGGYVRDDRKRVQAIVNATADWYGRVKRSVEFSIRRPAAYVAIGDLVTHVGGFDLSQDINTPVTSITYNLGDGTSAGSVRVATGFAEVDFT